MASAGRALAAARFVAAALAMLAMLAIAPAAAQAQLAAPVATAFFSQDAAMPGTDVGAGFSVANPNAGQSLSNVAVGMTLPAGLVLATPSQLSTTCADATATAPAGGTQITLTGATLGPADEELPNSCSVVFDVVAAGPGVVTIATGAPTSSETGAGSPSAGASMRVLAPPTLAQSFDDTSIIVGETARVTYTMTNPNQATQLYNLAFDDTLPTGLVVATPANAVATCVTDGLLADPGATTISLLGLQVDAASTCSVSVDVTGTSATVSPNSTGPLSFSYDAGGGDLRAATAPGASDTLVVIAPPALTLAFGAATIVAGASTTLTFTLANTNPALALSAVGFTDALPAGLVVATPSGLGGACGGATITAAAGSGSIVLAGAALAAASGCTFSVGVTALTPGQKVNATSTVSSAEAGSGAAATASLLVAAPPAPPAPPIGLGVPPPPPPPPPAAPGLPSNRFKVTKFRLARDGTARFDVAVPGAGSIMVLGKLGPVNTRVRRPVPFTIARRTIRPKRAATLHVTLRPNARGRSAIRRLRVARRVTVRISYRPTGGRTGKAVVKTAVLRPR